jgi:hypothetical protein
VPVAAHLAHNYFYSKIEKNTRVQAKQTHTRN